MTLSSASASTFDGGALSTTVETRRVSSGEPDEKRVEAITALLEESPRGLGESIANRGAWEAYPNRKAMIEAAETALGQPIPALTDEMYLNLGRTGVRAEYELPYSERTSRLSYFTIAECIENEGCFLPAIDAELVAILEERTWTVPSHDRDLASFKGQPILDLGAAMRGWTLASVDHLLGDKLKPETRAELCQQVNRRVFDVYRAQVKGPYLDSREWWHLWDSNWNAVCHAGVVGAALALLPDRQDRAWFIASAELYSSNYLAGFSPDGYCSEGIGYWSYGFGHYVAMAETIGRATSWRLNLLTPELVRRVAEYPDKVELVPDVYPAFSDNRPNRRPLPWVKPLMAMRLGKGTFPRSSINLDRVPVHPLGAMLYETLIVATAGDASPGAKSGRENGWPLRDRFPDAGVVISRTASPTAETGWGVAFKGGHNAELHNHNDVGSYVLAVDGQPLLVDPGMEVYSVRTFGPKRYESAMHNSYGHAVPVVAGQLQQTGAQARGVLTVMETSEAADVYSLDFTAAYAGAVPSLRKLQRRLEFSRSPIPSLEVADEVIYDSPQSFETALVTFASAGIVEPNQIVISDGNRTLRIQVTASGPFTLDEELLDENLPNGEKPRRIAIRLNEPSREARISYRVEQVPGPHTATISQGR